MSPQRDGPARRFGLRRPLAVALITILVALVSAAVYVVLPGPAPARVVSDAAVSTPGADPDSRLRPHALSRPQNLDSTLALTPPMGWNGFNRFHLGVNAAMVEAQARALVASGMKDAGYVYVNLDGGWDLLQRGRDGELLPDPRKFPQGIKPVVSYVHALGLKFGIYTSAGFQNCAGTSAGSFGYYQQDANQFASWGVDYLKLDWCLVPFRAFRPLTTEQVSRLLAAQMARALVATHRPIVLDINDYRPDDRPWFWAGHMAKMWRTTPDIHDSFASMLSNFRLDVTYSAEARPGAWNDPDMLEVGNGGMTQTEYQSQFSLWAEMAAPLIAGCDVTAMSAQTLSILTNLAVIAVDQDQLGRQGYAVSSKGGLWVITKPLANGDRAVVLFNSTGHAATISTTIIDIGLGGAPEYAIDDLWSGAWSETTGAIRAAVPAHSVVMFRISRIHDSAADGVE